MFLLTVVIAFFFITAITAQEIHLGKCPEISTFPDFDVEKYMGEWYEITKFYFRALEGERCLRANYSLKADGHVKVVNQGLKADGTPDVQTGDAVSDPNDASKLSVQFPGSPLANYWVIETDYENYALVWSCADVLFANFEFAWILSRKRTLDDAIVTKLKEKLASFGIKTNGFIITDQTNCPQ